MTPPLPEPTCLASSLITKGGVWGPLYSFEQMTEYGKACAEAEREACARLCVEMQEHWAAYKDTALLNGDVELSIAASGEPRAAESLADLIRARSQPEHKPDWSAA